MQVPIQSLLLRATWLKVHLYIALSVGFLMALIGLTGSLSVYSEEIDILLNPELSLSQAHGKYQSLDRIMAAVKQAHPNRHGSWTLEMPRNATGMATAWYDKPRETFFELYAPLMVSVNPYSAEVVASRFWGQTFSTWVLDVHTQLRCGRWGWQVVGAVGLLLLVSTLTGLYLWWPGIRRLGSAFVIRHRAGMIRLAFDLHRTLGLLSAMALLVLASSGVLLSYPQILEKFAGSSGMAHGETGRSLTSTAIPNNHPTGLAAASFVAQGPFPKAELRRVTTPQGDTGIYRINLRQAFEVNQRHPYTTVWVDRWSGQIKEVRNPSQFSDAETFATWIWPLHTGEALGGWGRFAWFCAGQSLFFLYVTGLLRWLHQRGLVKDRPVNLSLAKTYAQKLVNTAWHLLIRLSALVYKLTKLAQPYVLMAYKDINQWMQRQLIKWLLHVKRLNDK